MALLDGALLGLALAAHPDDFPAAVKEYEREMFERTSAAGRMSAHVQAILTSPDASQKMLGIDLVEMESPTEQLENWPNNDADQ